MSKNMQIQNMTKEYNGLAINLRMRQGRILSLTGWRIGFFVIIGLALLTRFWNLGNFPHPVFDETGYATMATQYLGDTAFIDVHPPVARFIFALAAKIGGAEGSDRFPSSDIPYGDFPYRLLRGASALAGVLLVLFIMLLVKEATKSPVAGLIAGLLALFENFLAVQSRYILADIFLVLFGVIGLWFFLRKDREIFKSRRWYLWLTLAGAFFGLSIGVKVSGIVFLLTAWFFYSLQTLKPERKTSIFSVFLVLIPFLVVFSSMFAHFSLFDPDAPVWNHIEIGKDSTVTEIFEKLRVQNPFLKFGPQIGLFGERLLESTLGLLLTAASHFEEFEHRDYASPWYSWPLMIKPITVLNQPINSSYQTVSFFGNPIIWWGGLIALIAILAGRLRRRVFKNADFLLFGYGINLALMAVSPRELFIYHYLPSLIFLIAITAIALNKLVVIKPKIILALFALILASFIFFSPLTYGTALSTKALGWRIWLPSWQP